MIQGCRQAAQGPAAPSAPTDLWNQQQEPTSELQSRPLWTSPLLHHPFPKAEDTDRANSFAPQRSHKSPACPALGKAVSLLPSTASFPSSNTSQRGNSPSTARVSQPQRNDAGWETAAAKPSEGRGPGAGAPVGSEEQELRGRGAGAGVKVLRGCGCRAEGEGQHRVPGVQHSAPGGAALNARGAAGQVPAPGSPRRAQPGPARAPTAVPPCPPAVLTRRGRCRCCRTPCGCRPGSSPPPRCAAGRWAA